MATQLPLSFLGLDYVRSFTTAYRRGSALDVYQREMLCEDVQFPAVLVGPRPADMLAGKRLYPEVGYSVQYGGLGYYHVPEAFDAAILSREHSEAELAEWETLRKFWQRNQTAQRCWQAFPDATRKCLPDHYDGGVALEHPAFPLYRMAGLQLDYGKLVRLGIDGLEKELSMQVEDNAFLSAALASIQRIRRCASHYLKITQELADRSESTARLATVLEAILHHPPRSFHEALELILLVQTMSGTINFGRLDVVLGPFLCRDLESGALDWNGALALMRNFYTILEEEILHFDARIIVGGAGRANEAEADRFALLAMETTASLDLPLPQLTLRFYSGQDRALLEKAYDIIALGKTFPMLYNDEVNVPAVRNAFRVDEETARQYLPFGCGEYMIDHASCGTPNAIINLQRCLESAINHGRCLRTGRSIGPDFGALPGYNTFDDLWEAYARTVEYYLAPLARVQATIYEVLGHECPFSLVSLLYDDCVARRLPIFNGGIRFLGGTNETYGNTNVADSLTAIQELVFRTNKYTADQLLEALRNNWNGFEAMQCDFKSAPKYGNDDEIADSMLAKVHEHVCLGTSGAARGGSLHHFLVVVINNNHNTLWGKTTSPSADGRRHGEPLAPGNSAGAGADRNGLTALLNSQAKPDAHIHAGTVQNVKISADFPRKHRELYHALFGGYFKQGGTQAMITVTRREDLLAALEHPEHYANLIVRVGGFSARFVDLDTATQQEILSRTEHAA